MLQETFVRKGVLIALSQPNLCTYLPGKEIGKSKHQTDLTVHLEAGIHLLLNTCHACGLSSSYQRQTLVEFFGLPLTTCSSRQVLGLRKNSTNVCIDNSPCWSPFLSKPDVPRAIPLRAHSWLLAHLAHVHEMFTHRLAHGARARCLDELKDVSWSRSRWRTTAPFL